MYVTPEPEAEAARGSSSSISPIVDDECLKFWDQFGPGAVGVGWDLTLLGLRPASVEPGETIDHEAAEAWSASDEGKDFVRRSSEDWCEASIAFGTDSAAAREAARPDDGLLYRRGRTEPGRRLMHAFDVLGDPVRRRILELLAGGEHASGEMVAVVQREFGITQPAVSQHLKVLRESGFATVRADGQRRLYCRRAGAAAQVDHWLDRFRAFWEPKLEALATEIARGKRRRRQDED